MRQRERKISSQKSCPATLNQKIAQPFYTCLLYMGWGRELKKLTPKIFPKENILLEVGRENSSFAHPKPHFPSFFQAIRLQIFLLSHFLAPSPLFCPSLPCPILSFRFDSFAAPEFRASAVGRSLVLDSGGRARRGSGADALIPAGDPAGWALLAILSPLQFSSLCRTQRS